MGYRLKQLTAFFAVVALLATFIPHGVEASVGLESYFCDVDAQSDFASTTYADYLSCTVDRSAASGAKDFFIFANLNTSVSTPSADPKVRFRNGGTVLSEYADGFQYSASSHGHNYTLVKEVNLTAASHTIDIQIANDNIGNVEGQNAQIIVLEKSANAQYAENTSATGTGASTSYQTALTLSFTPSEIDDWIIVWSAEVKHEDESDFTSEMRFVGPELTTTIFESNEANLVTASNDNKYYSQGGTSFHNLDLTSVPEEFAIQIKGGGTNDETYINNAAIVAMPYSDFLNVYDDYQAPKVQVVGTTYQDTNLSITETVNAGTHIAFVGQEASNESGASMGAWRLVSDAGSYEAYAEHLNLDDRDEDSDDWYLGATSYATTTAAGSFTWKTQQRSSSGSTNNESTMGDGYLVVVEVQGTDNNVPVIDDAFDSPDPVNVNGDIVWEVNWHDDDSEGVKMLICKTNSITTATPACPGGEWASDKDTYDTADPLFATYTAQSGDIGTNNWFAFVCDDEPACSVSSSGTFDVTAVPNPSRSILFRGKGTILFRGNGTILMR